MAEKKTFYITTPIYYPSDKLHIGHSYTTVAADAIARYKRMTGYDVYFLTGSDEHGQKIERKAKAKGITPKQYVDEIVASFKDLWKLMCISNDGFVRTTDDYHVKAVQKIFRKLYEQGDIYKSAYEGWYCTPCESFWLERQLKDGCCPDFPRPAIRWTPHRAPCSRGGSRCVVVWVPARPPWGSWSRTPRPRGSRSVSSRWPWTTVPRPGSPTRPMCWPSCALPGSSG